MKHGKYVFSQITGFLIHEIGAYYFIDRDYDDTKKFIKSINLKLSLLFEQKQMGQLTKFYRF